MKLLAPLVSLVLLASCASTHSIDPVVAGESINFSGAQVVKITLSNFDFAPSPISLKSGRTYALRLTNRASGGHDFTAPEFFAAALIVADDVSMVQDGQIELAGGQSATIHLVPGAGEFDLFCTHTGHARLGMGGTIIVN